MVGTDIDRFEVSFQKFIWKSKYNFNNIMATVLAFVYLSLIV